MRGESKAADRSVEAKADGVTERVISGCDLCTRSRLTRGSNLCLSVIARACRCDHTGPTVSRLSKSNKRETNMRYKTLARHGIFWKLS